MKIARFVLKIVGTCLALAAAACCVIAYWDKITEFVHRSGISWASPAPAAAETTPTLTIPLTGRTDPPPPKRTGPRRDCLSKGSPGFFLFPFLRPAVIIALANPAA